MSQIEHLQADIVACNISIPGEEWQSLLPRFTERRVRKRDVLLAQTEICNEMLFVTDGVLASEYVADDKPLVSRFFRRGNFCTNMVSAHHRELSQDNVIALTDASVISMPYQWFMEQYLRGAAFGVYLRIKVIHNMLEAKNFVSLKTLSDNNLRYDFLLEEYPDIVEQVPDKFIGAFLGITAEAMSRFLSRRREKLNQDQSP